MLERRRAQRRAPSSPRRAEGLRVLFGAALDAVVPLAPAATLAKSGVVITAPPWYVPVNVALSLRPTFGPPSLLPDGPAACTLGSLRNAVRNVTRGI